MRLFLLVAVATGLALTKKNPQSLSISRTVAVLASQHLVLRLQRPPGLGMIEFLLAANRFPAHQVEATPSVLLMAVLARLALHSTRCVKPLVCRNALAEILMIMAAKTPVAGERLSVGVTRCALVLPLERRVAR